MTIALVITCPAAERDAINAELAARGHGACLSTPLLGDRPCAFDEETGALLETPTHYGCHWWVADHEPTLATLEELRDTLFANSHIVIRGDAPPETTLDVIEGDIADVTGTWGAMTGDCIVLTHKEFSPGQWGWRAELNVQSESFEPGVRAVAIYSDAEHTQYLYTTGAFTWDEEAQRWATQWNAGAAAKATYHWAILYASLQEQTGTLAADADASALFLRFGLPAQPQPGETWIDTGVTVVGVVAAGVYRVSANLPGLVAGTQIKLGDAETVFNGYWSGFQDYLLITPHVSAAVGATVWRWG